MSTIRRTLLATAALALVAVPAMASHSWANYHWSRTGTLVLTLGDNVSSGWDAYLADANADWTASSVINTSVVAGASAPRTCKAVAGTVQVCNSTYGSNGWLGIASISVNGSHITAATVKLNDTYFNTAQYNTPAWRRLVTCQEVGHTFGLAHQDENFNNANLNTCMDYTNLPDSNQHPNNHDYTQLETIYAHTGLTEEMGLSKTPPPPAMTQIQMNGPGQWGELQWESEDHLSSRYLLDFGNGHAIVTEVFWVPGMAPHDGHDH